MKLIFVIFFLLPFLACSQAPTKAPSVISRETQSLKDVAAYCTNLLTSKVNDFSFEKFCAVRAKFVDKTITEKDFDGWREMAVEELMALIELHTQQTQSLTKGLELEHLNEKKMKALNKAVLKLQKTEKNAFRRVRSIVSTWYEITHSENLKLTFKKNPLTVEKFFVKIRQQNRLERLEKELASRSAVEVFKEAGLSNNGSWWERTKNWVGQPVQKPVDPSAHALLEALPSLLINRYTVQTALWTFLAVPFFMAGDYAVFLPFYDIETAAKLANEVQQEMATGKGLEEAKALVLSRNTRRNTINSYLNATAKYVNAAMFAALLVWVPYDHFMDKRAQNIENGAKISAAMNAAPIGSEEEEDRQIIDSITEDLIKMSEDHKGRKLTESERALIRKNAIEGRRAAKLQMAKAKP